MQQTFKNDRRSVRTRRAIKLAFFKLIKTKDIADVSITELTKSAGVNRNSFYTHYKSVNNILDDINYGILAEVDKILKKYDYNGFKEDPKPLIMEVSNLIADNKFIAEYLLFSKNALDLVNKLKRFVCDRCVEAYKRERGEVSPYIPYMVAFLIGGVFDMYGQWFLSDKQIPLENITEKIVQFLSVGIRGMQELK